MPEWLRQLLIAQGSLGFADTLHTLVGAVPQYQQVPNRQMPSGDLMAAAGFNERREPVMAITPLMMRQYGRTQQGVKRGDKFLAHEFGHLATGPAVGINEQLRAALVGLNPEGINEPAGNEVFADDFQQAIQALRSHSQDVGRLSPQARNVLEELLKQPVYSKHPINNARAFNTFVHRLPKDSTKQ